MDEEADKDEESQEYTESENPLMLLRGLWNAFGFRLKDLELMWLRFVANLRGKSCMLLSSSPCLPWSISQSGGGYSCTKFFRVVKCFESCKSQAN